MSDDSPGAAAGGEGGQPQAADAANAKEGKDGGTSEGADRDRLGGPSQALRQAYGAGRISLGGGSAYVGDGRFGRDLHIGDTYILSAGRGVALSPGPVRPEDLERVRERYTPVAEYDRIRAALTDRRLVLLRGFQSTGRATTALRVLDEVAAGNVFRLDIDDELNSVEDKDLAGGGGYLIELTDLRVARSLVQTQLDRLSGLLERCGCFCVVLTEHGPRHQDLLGGYVLECSPPDPDSLLARHIGREMRAGDADELEHDLVELSGRERLRAAVGPRPRPAETFWLARLLVDHGRGKITLDQVEARCAEFVPRQVEEWFSGLRGLRRSDAADHALRLAGFRIALAVFNNSPYHIVREAGEDLSEELMLALWPKRTPGRILFTDDQETWLAGARATLDDGHMALNDAQVPVKMVRFHDARFPREILGHVWLRHHNVREPLQRWLERWSKDPRDFVWVRPMQAAGLLCALDFPYTFHNVIHPAAQSEDVAERKFAAVALDQAALDDQARPVIAEYLKAGVRRGGPDLQWTVAHTFGYEVGLESIEDSLEWLRILGTRQETQPELDADALHELVMASADSMSRLFAAGAARPVLARLGQWTHPRQRRSLHELASWTILFLAHTYVDDLVRVNALLRREILAANGGRERQTPSPERKHWPVLLALQEEDAGFTAPVAALIRHALRSSRGAIAEWVLERWIRAGQRDQTCLEALARFVPHLVHDEGDRRRLRYLVTRLRRDWAEPLRDDVAARLEAVINHPLVQEMAQ